jgi:hypothetical protein
VPSNYKILKGFSIMLVLALIALSAHGVGYAQASDLCKDAKIVDSPWAKPPPNPPGKKTQSLMMCQQEFMKGIQYCVYMDPIKNTCTVMLDNPKAERWISIPVDCASGQPLEEAEM